MLFIYGPGQNLKNRRLLQPNMQSKFWEAIEKQPVCLIICTKETVRRFFKKYLEKIVNISKEFGTKKVFLFDSCAK